MSKFVGIARQHWTTHRPQQAALMSDADFERIGEEIEAQVQALAASIAGPDTPGEGYLEKVARLMSARMTAESDVLRERLPASTVTDPIEESDRGLTELRSASWEAQLELWALEEIGGETFESPQAEQRAFQSALAQLRADHAPQSQTAA